MKASNWQMFVQETGVVEAPGFSMACNRCTKDSHCGDEDSGTCDSDTNR